MKNLKLFLSRQLARPTGILARLLLGSLWNRRNTALNDAAFSRLSSVPTARVLEVGFGGGYLLERILTEIKQSPMAYAAGIDHSPEMVKLCQARFHKQVQSGRLCLALASAEAIPWARNSFDCVLSVNSIFYWADPNRACAEFSRVLSPYGRLVLVYTCSDDLKNRPFDSHSLGLYTPNQVQHWLRMAGFVRIDFTQEQDRHRRFWCVEAALGEEDRVD